MSNNFLDLLSTHFLICTEKIKGKGEDSGYESYNIDAGVMGAFDGCGGLGAKSCSKVSDMTEAYLASRSIANAVKQWFQFNIKIGYQWNADILKRMIISNLEMCRRYAQEPGLRLMGSMVRPFPSTVAMVAFQNVNKEIISHHFWAGDSRTYVLDRKGLGQISVDDLKGEDAMSNLTRDGALTNVVSVDKKFVLHTYQYKLTQPCIMLCATDGCFGYVSSPMEFELMLLSSLINAKNVEEWQNKLRLDISDRSGDDQTIAVAAFGFESFNELKQYYLDRYYRVKKICEEFEISDIDVKQHLWEEYKPNYYRNSAKTE